MGAITKRVNVYAKFPVRSLNPVIHGVKKDTIMTSSDILKCLCRGAKVEEILPNGSTINLNMNNYYTDNGAGLDANIIPNNTISVAINVVNDHVKEVVNNAPASIEEEHHEEMHIEETHSESEEKVECEAPDAPIEAQVVETKSLDDANEDAKTEEKEVVEESTAETEAEPAAVSVSTVNVNTSKKNKKRNN